jgi:hypothetical protein
MRVMVAKVRGFSPVVVLLEDDLPLRIIHLGW